MKLGIPSSLRAEDIISGAFEESSIITYISQYYYAFERNGSTEKSPTPKPVEAPRIAQTRTGSRTFSGASGASVKPYYFLFLSFIVFRDNNKRIMYEKLESLRTLVLMAIEDINFQIFDLHTTIEYLAHTKLLNANKHLVKKMVQIAMVIILVSYSITCKFLQDVVITESHRDLVPPKKFIYQGDKDDPAAAKMIEGFILVPHVLCTSYGRC